MSRAESQIARELASLSTREIVDAIGVGQSSLLKSVVTLLARGPSSRLGCQLSRFDVRVATVGIAQAAREALAAFGARVDVDGVAPKGPLLVVANHPGAFDALALLAALARADAYVLAADRLFLRAMPHLAKQLVLIPEKSAFGRVTAFRRATELLRAQSVLLHFGAGSIEADVHFPSVATLSSWPAGTGALALAAARQGALVIPAFIAGVHSPRAKRLRIVRFAERRGVTMVAPLIQATVPGFRDVNVSIKLGAPLENRALRRATDDIERTSMVRAAVAALGQSLTQRRNDAIAAAHFGRTDELACAASFRRASSD